MEFQAATFLLRQIKLEDRNDLANMANNRKIWINLRDHFPHPYSLKDADSYIDMIINEHPQFSFAIEYDGMFAGMIGLVGLADVYSRTAEIGYWLGEPYWGNGITTEACQIVTNYALNTLDFIRLQAGIFEYNEASMRVLEKCGYKKESVGRNAVFKAGKVIDEHRYAIVKDLD